MTHTHFISRFIDEILLKVISLGDSYGYSISKTIAHMTGGHWQIKEATLYSGLRRLEKEKYIYAYWGDETQGGRRKYYGLTPAGHATLAAGITHWQQAKTMMDQIFEWRQADEQTDE